MAGRMRPASNAMIARTQTTSISVNPAARLMAQLLRRALDLAVPPAPLGSPLGPYEADFIGRMVRRRPIDGKVGPRDRPAQMRS